jgi:thiol-disulfide isomerase/thioredoxin
VTENTEHKIIIGKVSPQDIWEELPNWKVDYDDYVPNQGVVNILRAVENNYNIVCVMGTWCPDSRNGVPTFLKALDLAQNPNLDLEVYTVDRNKKDPEQIAQKLAVAFVPTFIIYYQGLEVFRMIETPEESFEQDFAKFIEIFQEN